MRFAQWAAVTIAQLTGADCVEHLVRLGFRISRHGRGMTVLTRAGHRVAVPDVSIIDGPLLDAIVRSAGVPLGTFLALSGRSGVYARAVVGDASSTSESES